MASKNGSSAVAETPTSREAIQRETDGEASILSALKLERIRINRIEIPIEGITPLIAHQWSAKAKEMLMSTGQPRQKKAPRDPEGDFEAARYRLPDGRDGFPAVGFKAAIVGSARLFDGVTMTEVKQWFFVNGEGPQLLVPIEGDIIRREDPVRIGRGQADLRWRPQYDNWKTTLMIDYVASALLPESVLALVDAAGIGGVGEWRPSSPKGATGIYGRWRVSEKEGVNLTRLP